MVEFVPPKKQKGESSKEYRLRAKRSRRQFYTALYQSYRDAGITKRSRRAQKSQQRTRIRWHARGRHPTGPCPNVGCSRCFPYYSISAIERRRQVR